MKRQNQEYGEILKNGRQLGPYPMEKLKRVDQPTTKVTDDIKKFDQRQQVNNRAARGDLGPAAARRRYSHSQYPLAATMEDIRAHLGHVTKGEAASSKATLPEDSAVLSRHIKRLGYFFRADIVGICRLPQYAVLSHDKEGNPIELDHKFAIMVLVDQDYETMQASTGTDWISASQSLRSYSGTAFISCMMANYIRRLGYPAQAHHTFGHQIIIPPLLLMAGIGEMSRAGIILNPFLGLRFKAAVITTDLPLLPDKPIDFGLQEFCRKCMKCAVNCPSRAITTGDKIMYNGYECWKLGVEHCTKFRNSNPKGAGCGTCIKVCPWNKPPGWTHDVVRWLAMHAPFLDKPIVKMDDIMGYGKPNPKDKWWFDVKEVDATMKIPNSSD